MRARIAWSLAIVTVVCCVVDVAVTAAYRPLFSEDAVARHGFPFLNGAVLASAVLGATIVSRYERHPVGWLVCLIGVTSGFSQAAEAYSLWLLSGAGPGPGSLAGVTGWLASVLGGQLAMGGIALMFLLAPDGRLLSRRWRYAVAAVAVGELGCTAGLATHDPTDFDLSTRKLGPVGTLLFTIGFLLVLATLLAGLVSMLIRLRRSRGVQRQQMRLISVGATLLIAGVITLLVVQMVNGGEQTWAAGVPLYASFLLLPVLHTVAVLRYRLHDVEVIVNRAVVLAVGTAFAAVGYTTLVVMVGSRVTSSGGGLWLSLLATAMVALAFQPLRRGVVRVANRLAYGPRARPYVALSEFSHRLAATPSADTLLPAVAQAAGRAVSARGSTVTMTVPGAGIVSARSGETDSDGTSPYGVPVRSDDTTLGTITVSIPKGRPLRAGDARLLQALADQAAVAFRNTAMETRLAEHVAALDSTTHQLAESRSRIIEADDAARRALEAAISREILPRLAVLSGRVRSARAAVAAGSADNGLDELVLNTNDALDSLRQMTRGVFPTQLARNGLEPALRSHLAKTGLTTKLVFDVDPVGPVGPVDPLGRRLPDRVERALYFCCAEAAGAMSDSSVIDLTAVGGALVLRITGVATDAMDLQAVMDRVAAVDGSLTTTGDVLVLDIPDQSSAMAAL